MIEQLMVIPSVVVGARMTTSRGTEKEVSVAAGSSTEEAEHKQGALPPVLSLPFYIYLNRLDALQRKFQHPRSDSILDEMLHTF